MKSKNLITIIITSLLLFSACGSDEKDEKQIEAPGKVVYETGEFSLELPKEWETIEKNTYPSNVPAEILVGFRSNIKNDIFTANLNVAKKELSEEKTGTLDFAKGSLATIKKNLIGFQLINENKGQIGELDTYILEFKGKKTSSEPVIHFKQLYVAKNSLGYTITASYLPTEDESVVNALQEMLDSFALK